MKIVLKNGIDKLLFGMKQQVAAGTVKALTGFECHVDLAGTVVESYGPSGFDVG